MSWAERLRSTPPAGYHPDGFRQETPAWGSAPTASQSQPKLLHPRELGVGIPQPQQWVSQFSPSAAPNLGAHTSGYGIEVPKTPNLPVATPLSNQSYASKVLSQFGVSCPAPPLPFNGGVSDLHNSNIKLPHQTSICNGPLQENSIHQSRVAPDVNNANGTLCNADTSRTSSEKPVQTSTASTLAVDSDKSRELKGILAASLLSAGDVESARTLSPPPIPLKDIAQCVDPAVKPRTGLKKDATPSWLAAALEPLARVGVNVKIGVAESGSNGKTHSNTWSVVCRNEVNDSSTSMGVSAPAPPTVTDLITLEAELSSSWKEIALRRPSSAKTITSASSIMNTAVIPVPHAPVVKTKAGGRSRAGSLSGTERSAKEIEKDKGVRRMSQGHAADKDKLYHSIDDNGKVNFLFSKMDAAQRLKMKFDSTALFSVTDQKTADQITDMVKALPGVDSSTRIVDGTACVGGNVISFAADGAFSEVWAIELDPNRFELLKNNLNVALGKRTAAQRVHCLQGDFTHHVAQLDGFEEFGRKHKKEKIPLEGSVVFLDPPWGGPDYREAREVGLELSGVSVGMICRQLRGHCRYVVIKAPTNFGLGAFSRESGGAVTVHRNLRKMLLVIVDDSVPEREEVVIAEDNFLETGDYVEVEATAGKTSSDESEGSGAE